LENVFDVSVAMVGAHDVRLHEWLEIHERPITGALRWEGWVDFLYSV
jgi:hypothetical protein